MFIKSISSNFIDSYGRTMKRITNFGKYKGNSIAIDTYKYKGEAIFKKRFVIWNDKLQKIVNKYPINGGGWEVIG